MAKTPLSAHGHVVPIWKYAVVLVILLVLMALTIAVSYVEMPTIGPISGNFLNNFLALFIATIKALFVIMIFMGLKWASNTARLWIIGGFSWFMLMFLMFLDYGTRKYEAPLTIQESGRGYTDPWGGGPETALPREIQQGSPPPPNDDYINVRPRQ